MAKVMAINNAIHDDGSLRPTLDPHRDKSLNVEVDLLLGLRYPHHHHLDH